MEKFANHFGISRRVIIITVLTLAVVLVYFLYHLNSIDIPQPLAGSAGISATLMRTVQGPPSGPTTSVDDIFTLWNLEANTDQIRAATCGDRIYDSLEWHMAQPDRMRKILEFLKQSDAFNEFQPYILDMLNDPDLRCAYRDYGTYPNGEISYVAMWVCSPKLREIAFLSSPD